MRWGSAASTAPTLAAAIDEAAGGVRVALDGVVPDLTVAFVGISRREYLKYWVAPFLYDRRTFVRPDQPVPQVDLLVVPAERDADGWRVRERVAVRRDVVRALLVPAAVPSP